MLDAEEALVAGVAEQPQLLVQARRRDAGVDVGVFDDIDGDQRPANLGFDIGADERPGAVLRPVKTASSPAVNRGQTFTYTIRYGNDGPAEASGVWLTDTLPVSVTTTAPTVVGPLTLPVGSSYTWTLTATLSVDIVDEVVLSNTVTIAGTTTDHSVANNVAEAYLTTTPYRVHLPAIFRDDKN